MKPIISALLAFLPTVFRSRLSRRWSGWRDALVFVQTGTVIAWQRKRFRDH